MAASRPVWLCLRWTLQALEQEAADIVNGDLVVVPDDRDGGRCRVFRVTGRDESYDYAPPAESQELAGRYVPLYVRPVGPLLDDGSPSECL